MKKALLVLFALAAVSPGFAHARDIAAAIDEAAQAAVDAGESPGLQVAVYKDGKPLLVKGYGLASLELNVPVNNDTVFRIGSITKQFAAAALLQLRDEGRLSLADRLSKYYPDYPRAADITLEQMLHHTSGMHNYTEDETFAEEKTLDLTTDERVQRFAGMKTPQDFEPGTSWYYSNTAYFLLGGVIEKVEGKPLAAVLKERFFIPLGMTRTAMDDEKEIVPGRAAGYRADAEGNFQNAGCYRVSWAGAAGAMRSTASDMVRWNRALFGGKVLKPETFQAMMTPARLSNGQLGSTALPPGDNRLAGGEYGYGIVVAELEGHTWIGHGGGIDGFTSWLAEFPDDGLTVAVNSNGIGADKGAFRIAERIQRIALGLGPKK